MDHTQYNQHRAHLAHLKAMREQLLNSTGLVSDVGMDLRRRGFNRPKHDAWTYTSAVQPEDVPWPGDAFVWQGENELYYVPASHYDQLLAAGHDMRYIRVSQVLPPVGKRDQWGRSYTEDYNFTSQREGETREEWKARTFLNRYGSGWRNFRHV